MFQVHLLNKDNGKREINNSVDHPEQNDFGTTGEGIEILQKALADEKNRSNDYLNQLKYLQADMENLQKRTKKELDITVQRANENLISKLLVILDDMELALKSSLEDENCRQLKSGFQLILDKMQHILEKEGLVRIDAVGKQFDPTHHEAVDQTLRDDKPDGLIMEEIKSGYAFKGKLLRSSLVTISRNPREVQDKDYNKSTSNQKG
jgi:molecular chaperone GrpE